jgi:hypothetical protein
MTNKNMTFNARRWCSLVAGLALVCAASVAVMAQTPFTPGGTTITNTVTSSYSDGTNSYATTSNTVTVTVSNIAGLTITPDAGTNPTVVLDQTLVDFNFTVTNTGNFTNQVDFKASGASIIKTGAATVTAAVIDVDKSGTINAGDTDIFTNGSAVTSANVLQDGTLFVIVRVTVNSGAATASTINIQLGDAAGGSPWDNKVLAASAADVVTHTAGTNGQEEARGDITATVANDALIRLTLTAPSGPVAVGSDITYAWVLTNDGSRTANSQTLSSNPGIFIVVPIPARTKLKNTTGFPVGTLYTADAITTAPLAASWSSTAPALNTVTRVALKTGTTLAAGASTTSINVVVTVQTGISIVLPVRELGDAFDLNFVGASKTDQSGDARSNIGDGNADFTEGNSDADADGHMQDTNLSSTGGSVQLGPLGFQAAVGPTNTNDDYTNRSVNTGIATVAPGGNTSAQGIVTFTNTVGNTGDADDTFTFTAPTVPAGFTVEVSTDAGSTWTTLSGGGSKTLAVAYGATATIQVKVTEPSANVVLTAYPTIVRATSLNTTSATNDTIDRLYTGYLQLTNSQTVANATSRGTATEAVPGATVAYVVAYDNVTSSGGTNNSTITASNIVLIEPVPANTDFQVSSGTSNPSVGITVVIAYSNDSGSTWTYTPVSAGGGAPAGFDRSVTHVRFTLTGPMSPTATPGDNGFTVRIR